MIVPRHWAEGRARHREAGKQVTVRRFGWSDAGQADAQTHADQRANEALQRLLSGENLNHREPKAPYNGADGVPIREEILDQRGETIITRNSYGARCLNTPNVFFADIDFQTESSIRAKFLMFLILVTLSVLIGVQTHSKGLGIAICIVSLFLIGPLSNFVWTSITHFKGGVEKIAIDRIKRFASGNPTWNFVFYRTPAGLRVLATHQLFQPGDPEVARCFAALGTDPLYRKMCLKQQCFRARVSPKPWRIGLGHDSRPRLGTWPVTPYRLPIRTTWLEKYDAAATMFSSCRFIGSIGSGIVHSEVLPVQLWHDELSRANSQLPIA